MFTNRAADFAARSLYLVPSEPVSDLQTAQSTDCSVAPTVLVAFSNADYRSMVAITLSRQGYKVEEAADSLTLLEYISNHKAPALLLIDLHPDLAACEVISSLRRLPAVSHLPIIAFASDDGLRPAALAAGANDFILKSSVRKHEAFMGRIKLLCPCGPESLC